VNKQKPFYRPTCAHLMSSGKRMPFNQVGKDDLRPFAGLKNKSRGEFNLARRGDSSNIRAGDVGKVARCIFKIRYPCFLPDSEDSALRLGVQKRGSSPSAFK
jgi:hypothetical protein